MSKQKTTIKRAARTIAKITMGVGVLAEAAGAYFSGPKGLKRRAAVKSWTLKMKGDVLEEIEHLKDLGERQYREIIDGAALRYRALRHVDPKELEVIARELKGHWRNIRRDVNRAMAGERKKPSTTRKARTSSSSKS